MKSYGWSPDFVRRRLIGAQGWAYYNWALENEATVWGNGVERTTDGYIAQEIKRIKAKRHGRA